MEPEDFKIVVGWIDHEKATFESLDQVAVRRVHQRGGKRIHECCKFIDLRTEPAEVSIMADHVSNLISVRPVDDDTWKIPDLLLVDLNFGKPFGDNEEYPPAQRGMDLALELSRRFPDIAVGMYSAKGSTGFYKVKASTLGLPIFLYDIKELIDSDLRPLTGDDWYNLFTLAIQANRTGNERSTDYIFAENSRVRWLPGHPLHRSMSFERVAPNLVERALSPILDASDEVSISELSGGFSGSFVVKAALKGKVTSFVVKIDESSQNLKRELLGYRQILKNLDNHFLTVLAGFDFEPVTPFQNWWSAFAMQFDGVSKPLLDNQHRPLEELQLLYRKLWEGCLFSLYGSLSTDTIRIDELITSELAAEAIENWTPLARYHQELLGDESPEAFISSIADLMDEYRKGTVDSMFVESVHGDLNSRNILYNEDTKDFVLIDFPHVGSRDCLARDFVKAECELILLIMDRHFGRDIDPSRLPVWHQVITATSASLDLSKVAVADPEGGRIVELVKELRAIFDGKAPGGFGECYQAYLAQTLMKYSRYDDLTVPKRFLVYFWLAELLKQDWSESGK